MRTLKFVVPALLASLLAAGEPPSATPNPQPGPRPILRLFDMADADQDGRLTRAEVEQAIAARRQQGRAAHFEKLDANKDGVISRDEFLNAPPPKPRAHGRRCGPPTIDDIFERYDANRDGVITRDEISRACGQRGGQGRGKGSPRAGWEDDDRE